jgi:phospholipid/cholesterol/gamma-HCH transport system substrate-binding protein
MNLELPRRTVAAVLLFALVSLALLAYMLGRLGALPLPGSSTRQVRALLGNADGLPTEADVLVHGVKVGTVSGLSARRGGTLVTLTLGGGAPALHADATVEVGTKTPLGEPFVDLVPGTGPALRSGALIRARSAVAIDDALAWLDAGGRANLRSVLDSLGASAAPASTSAELSDTLAALPGTVASLDRLAATLSAQRAELTGIVESGRSVLGVLAARSAALRGLTVDAHTTLGAVAAQRDALAGTLARLPGLLSLTDTTLRAARPLIARAMPVAGDLASAAPALTSALRELPAVTTSADAILSRASAISAEVVPALRRAEALAAPARGALAILGPVLADVVPVAQYLAPRGNTIAAWFSNTADLGSHGDAKGDWARFFVMFDPSTLLGLRGGAPAGNAYTAPGDSAHNQAYAAGGYQRLMPYAPALGH